MLSSINTVLDDSVVSTTACESVIFVARDKLNTELISHYLTEMQHDIGAIESKVDQLSNSVTLGSNNRIKDENLGGLVFTDANGNILRGKVAIYPTFGGIQVQTRDEPLDYDYSHPARMPLLAVQTASPGAIESRASSMPVGTNGVDAVVYTAFCKPQRTYTSDEQELARQLFDTVGKTEYATATTAGVVKGDKIYGFVVTASGIPSCDVLSASEYGAKTAACFIGKGTLENAKNDIVKRAIVGNDITLTDAEKTSACDWLGALKQNSETSNMRRAYAIGTKGEQILITIGYSNDASNQSLVMRDTYGAIYVPDTAIGKKNNIPEGEEAVNRNFVKKALASKVVLDVTLTEAQAGASAVAVAIQDVDALLNAKRLFSHIRVPIVEALTANKAWFNVMIADQDKTKYSSVIHAGANGACTANSTVEIITNTFISDSETQDGYYMYHSICQPANCYIKAGANSKTTAVTLTGQIAKRTIATNLSIPPYLHISVDASGAVTFPAGTRIYMEAYE